MRFQSVELEIDRQTATLLAKLLQHLRGTGDSADLVHRFSSLIYLYGVTAIDSTSLSARLPALSRARANTRSVVRPSVGAVVVHS